MCAYIQCVGPFDFIHLHTERHMYAYLSMYLHVSINFVYVRIYVACLPPVCCAMENGAI